MLRFAAIFVFAFAVPAYAVDFTENDQGQIEFTMPSGNIGCVFTPDGGTDVYQTADGKAELACDRVKPSYKRVILGVTGKARLYNNAGDASCCASDNIFAYGEEWAVDGFSCWSTRTHLTCERGSHGFTMSRRRIETF